MNDRSSRKIPLLEEWDLLPQTVCEEVAKSLLFELPDSFSYQKLERCSMGGQTHTVAFFEWSSPHTQGKTQFALLPGTTITLGYDRTHPFVPTALQEYSWQHDTLERGYISTSLDAFLDQVMTPLRVVHLSPFLIQIDSTTLSTHPLLQKKGAGIGRMIYFQEVEALLIAEGFRLPTSDEWEYACSAGSQTLFRWGNETPDQHLEIPDPIDGFMFPVTWNTYLQPNAFGLSIASNPYRWELCSRGNITREGHETTTKNIMRGGDGGTALHAGIGTFAEWLTLSSFFIRDTGDQYMKRGGISGMCLRRAFSCPSW